MSKIIRFAESGPAVFIGDKHLDLETETLAEKTLAQFCPAVAIKTDAVGARQIPISEVFKIEKTFTDEKQKAYQQGVADGQARGLAEGLKKAEEVLQQFNTAISDIISQREAVLEEAKQKVLELVIQVSRKITFDAIEADPEKAVELIHGVIANLMDRSQLKIKVNPNHLPIIEQHIDSFMTSSAAIKQLTIEPDQRVRYGGCFIETPIGDIDARLDSQLKVIEDVLHAEEGE